MVQKLQPQSFILLNKRLVIIFGDASKSPVKNAANQDEELKVLCNSYATLMPHEDRIIEQFNSYTDSVDLTPEQEQRKRVIYSMYNIIVMYHEQMDDWNMMKEGPAELDSDDMNLLLLNENNIKPVDAVVVVAVPTAEPIIETIMESVSAPVDGDLIFSPQLNANQKALTVLAYVVINNISPKTSLYKNRYRTNQWTWGHFWEALVRIGLIDKCTPIASYSRAIHNLDGSRTAGSIKSAYNRYNTKMKHTNIDENIIIDMMKELEPVMVALAE